MSQKITTNTILTPIVLTEGSSEFETEDFGNGITNTTERTSTKEIRVYLQSDPSEPDLHSINAREYELDIRQAMYCTLAFNPLDKQNVESNRFRRFLTARRNLSLGSMLFIAIFPVILLFLIGNALHANILHPIDYTLSAIITFNTALFTLAAVATPLAAGWFASHRLKSVLEDVAAAFDGFRNKHERDLRVKWIVKQEICKKFDPKALPASCLIEKVSSRRGAKFFNPNTYEGTNYFTRSESETTEYYSDDLADDSILNSYVKAFPVDMVIVVGRPLSGTDYQLAGTFDCHKVLKEQLEGNST